MAHGAMSDESSSASPNRRLGRPRGPLRIGVVVALLFLCACQYDPYTFSYATSKPVPKEIVGHWIATEATLHDLASGPYNHARPVIDISEDGSIRMTDIPDTWRADFGKGGGKIETFIGTWQLEKQQDSWWGLDLQNDDWACGGCLMVLGEKSPRTLVLRFGDPDEGRGYEFQRPS
jgi:hypothetical protein